MVAFCLLVELAVLVALAWMEKLPQFLANVAAGFAACCFLVFLGGDPSFVTNLGVCFILGILTYLGATIVWHGVRVVCLAIDNPRGAVEALDTVMMENAVAKSLARDDTNPHSYGNRRVAREIVRALKERNPGE